MQAMIMKNKTMPNPISAPGYRYSRLPNIASRGIPEDLDTFMG
jgi:hypothetical protein